MNISRLLAFASVLWLLCGVTLAVSASEAFVYFGTFPNTGSKGIYVSKLDLSTGRLSPAEVAAESGACGFLAIHPNRQFLYSVGPIDKTSSGVKAYAIEPNTGRLKFLNQISSGGNGPCHVSINPSGKCALVAHYGGGNVSVLPIDADGRVGERTAFVQHTGSSAHPTRQKGPHAHSINVDASDRFAFAADLGLDKVLIYRFDPARGSLEPNDPAFAGVKPGAGPRHFTFHPNNQWAYVINELDCTIAAFGYDSKRGELKETQTVSTLPGGQAVQEGFSTAEVLVHPSGKFLYGSNRGHNSIAVFALSPSDGKLSLIQNQATLGKTPRNFGIDPTGQFLLAANQESDNVAVFRIDPESGQLKTTGHTVAVPMPVCVKFLPGKESGFRFGEMVSFRGDGDARTNALVLSEGSRPVLVYNHCVRLKPGVPADRARSTYVHPIYGLDGEVLTDDFPKDHYHHRGLFWAWPHVKIGDKEVDLWMIKGIHQRFERWLKQEAGADSAVLGVQNGWYMEDKKVVDEQVWLRVSRSTRDEQTIDVDLTWTPIGEPLTLRGAEGKSYGGITLRFAPRQGETMITTPEGRSKEDLPMTRLPWADLSAQFAGASDRSGAAIFIHPQHPDYPPEWLTRNYGVLCVGWPGVKEQTFAPGKPIRCQYRVWIHRGAPEVSRVKRAYDEYTVSGR